MLHNAAVIDAVFAELKQLQAKNVVLDPVMVAKGGDILLELSAIDSLKKNIIGSVNLITPNMPEAERLLAAKISSQADMVAAAIELGKGLNLNVLVKGGHLEISQAPDVLYIKNEDRCYWFEEERIDTKNTHGTGCSFSAAIASYLAQEFSLYDAVVAAKAYLTKAIKSGAANQIGKGFGPVDHFYFLDNRVQLEV